MTCCSPEIHHSDEIHPYAFEACPYGMGNSLKPCFAVACVIANLEYGHLNVVDCYSSPGRFIASSVQKKNNAQMKELTNSPETLLRTFLSPRLYNYIKAPPMGKKSILKNKAGLYIHTNQLLQKRNLYPIVWLHRANHLNA